MAGTTRGSWLALAGFVVLCLTAGGLGGWAVSQPVVDWYPGIAKPSWNPPSWLFAPVWTTLYVMMAVAAWLVWLTGQRVRGALALFFIQLAFNVAWSFIFFAAHSPGWAFVEVLAFVTALALTTYRFFRHSTAAGLLMLPYLAWVSFAAVLNFAIWQLN
jgi:translocator protein